MIGLTGGIASGKSTVTARLSSLGAFVADADKVSREIMSDPKVLSRIREEFGGSVFAEDGGLLRTELALRVFSSEARTQLLNSITHPAIAERLLEMASEAEKSGEYPLVFVDAALLIESGFYKYCDSVWLVTADTSLRIRRIMDRDGLSYDEAKARIERQMPDEDKLRYADTVIENDSGIPELIEKTDAAFRREIEARDRAQYEGSPDNDTYIDEINGVYEEEER